MNANNELLLYINESADMGIKSIKKLIKLIEDKDNKIKKEIEDLLKGYEYFYKESKRLLKENKINPKTKLAASITANIAMMTEVNKDNSDTKIADILIRGFNMGSVEIEKRLNAIKDEGDKHILKLAKKLNEFSINSIKKLKIYL